MSEATQDSGAERGGQGTPAGPVRRALVTGASAGIGRAFADRLARDHFELVVVARREERLEALAAELHARSGVGVKVWPADLSDDADLARLADAVAERPPDLLINNAGFGTFGPFAKLDPDGELREVRLNVLAVVRLTRAALPGMIERGHGGIVNVSSLAGLTPGPYNATYAATKAYVTNFSESLFEELRGSGVKVQALLPGFTRTEFQEQAGVDVSQVPGFAWMTPEAVVEASLRALARGDAICIPGAGYKLLSALQGLAPRALTRRAVGLTMRKRLGKGLE
jgi:uncharacterized protein